MKYFLRNCQRQFHRFYFHAPEVVCTLLHKIPDGSEYGSALLFDRLGRGGLALILAIMKSLFPGCCYRGGDFLL